MLFPLSVRAIVLSILSERKLKLDCRYVCTNMVTLLIWYVYHLLIILYVYHVLHVLVLILLSLKAQILTERKWKLNSTYILNVYHVLHFVLVLILLSLKAQILTERGNGSQTLPISSTARPVTLIPCLPHRLFHVSLTYIVLIDNYIMIAYYNIMYIQYTIYMYMYIPAW